MMPKPKFAVSHSKFTGVEYLPSKKRDKPYRWKMRISIDWNNIRVSGFQTEIEAAAAYNHAIDILSKLIKDVVDQNEKIPWKIPKRTKNILPSVVTLSPEILEEIESKITALFNQKKYEYVTKQTFFADYNPDMDTFADWTKPENDTSSMDDDFDITQVFSETPMIFRARPSISSTSTTNQDDKSKPSEENRRSKSAPSIK